MRKIIPLLLLLGGCGYKRAYLIAMNDAEIYQRAYNVCQQENEIYRALNEKDKNNIYKPLNEKLQTEKTHDR